MSVTIYGAGEDLIEVVGDVDEEFTVAPVSQDGNVLAISEGTLLRIRRDDNDVWRIAPVVRGSGALTITQAPREGDADNHSDHASIRGLITWVVLGNSVAALRG